MEWELVEVEKGGVRENGKEEAKRKGVETRRRGGGREGGDNTFSIQFVFYSGVYFVLIDGRRGEEGREEETKN